VLARAAARQPIGLVLTYRSDEISPKLAHVLAQLDRARLATEIPLAPLDGAEIQGMLQAIFGLEKPPRTEFRDAISSLTGGNPFFIEEVLRSLVTQGDLYLSAGSWNGKGLTALRIPRSVQDAVRQRQEKLSPAAGGVLEIASALGQRFDFALLPYLTGLDDEEILACLKELVAAQLIVEQTAEQFAFRHALTQQAVYTSLFARERIALHRRVANAIEEIYGTGEAHLPDLAYHCYAGGVWPKALEYSSQVGERALRLYSPRAAVENLTRALDAAAQLGIDAAPSLTRKRGGAYEALGEWDAALADYEAALDAAQRAIDQRATWEALIDLGMLWAGRDYDRTHDYYMRALELAQVIGDPLLSAHSLNRIGNWHVNVEAPHEALGYHEQALTIFETAQDERGVAATLDFLGMASYLGGDLWRGTDYYRRAVRHLRAVDDRAALSSSLAVLTLRGATAQTSGMALPPGSLADCIRDGEEAIAVARGIEQRSGEAFALSMMAFCLTAAGEYSQARAYADEGSRIAEEIGHIQWSTAAECAHGTLAADLLDAEAARHRFERALELARSTKSGHWIHTAAGPLASICVADHDLERARVVLESLDDPNAPASTLGSRLVWCARIELALAERGPERALLLLEQMAAATPNLEAHLDCAPRMAMLHAQALAALDRLDEAQAELEAVREINREQGALPALWRVDLARGRIYAAQGRQEEAAEAFSLAQGTIQALAERMSDAAHRESFLARAAELLPTRAGPRGRRSTGPLIGGLTPREREVAVLIERGKSNREIAGLLYLGERTVETHVSNILAKLALDNRAQIAAWAATQNLGG